MREIEIFVYPDGAIRGIYSGYMAELTKDLTATRRAPRVSIILATDSCWYADLSQIGGPVLGPFPYEDRDAAVDAEEAWLNEYYLPFLQEPEVGRPVHTP